MVVCDCGALIEWGTDAALPGDRSAYFNLNSSVDRGKSRNLLANMTIRKCSTYLPGDMPALF
jgi:hypothetical protein